MAEATYVQCGDAIDYTPGSDVAAGQVVVLSELIGIAKTAIKANELGALAVEGVFDVAKEGGVAVTFAIWRSGLLGRHQQIRRGDRRWRSQQAAWQSGQGRG